MRPRVLIISSCVFPVPATKGGAVENLISCILEQNEKYQELQIDNFTIYEEQSALIANHYKLTENIAIKKPKWIEVIDGIIAKCFSAIGKADLFYGTMLWKLYVLYKVKSVLKKNYYDIVVSANSLFFMNAFSNKKLAQKYKGRVVFYLHNQFSHSRGSNAIIANCRRVLCVSKFVKKGILNKLPDLPANRVLVLMNAIDTKRFATPNTNGVLQLRYQMGLENKFVIVFAGRMIPEKGIFYLLDAVSQLIREGLDLTILALGGFNYTQNMENPNNKLLKRYKNLLQDRFITTGFVKYKEIQNYYAIGNIAVLPSFCGEAAGLTIMEATAVGLPLITTDDGGIPEYVCRKGTIIIKTVEDVVGQLKQAIRLLYENDDFRKQMSVANKKYAEENYGLENYYRGFVSLIMEENC